MLDTLLLILGLLFLSALFGVIEMANFTLSEGTVRTMVRKGLTGSRLVERLKAKRQKLLITVLAGNNIVNVLAAAIATELALELYGSRGVAIATGVITLAVLVFGDVLPKTFGQLNAERLSRYTAPIAFFLMFVLTPLTWMLEKLMWAFSFGRINRPAARAEKEIAQEEIRSLFQIGVEKGAIKQYEQDIAERLFRFNDMRIEDAMRPLGKVFMLESRLPVETALADAALSGYSRFPVYDGSVERVIGVVHIKDIVRAYSDGRRASTLSALVQPPGILRTGQGLSAAFTTMRKDRMPFALVYDEQNQLVGLVTLEDVLEQLVGEMRDETDARKWGPAT